MALPILDGNQTATTLSTVLTSGEHIPAHTVVSLGSTAISNIASAVSGSVVSVSNLPSTQTIAGTVTANLSGTKSSDESGTQLPTLPVQLVNLSEEIVGVPSNPLPISGTVTVGNDIIIKAPSGDQFGDVPFPIFGTVTANVAGNLNGTIENYDTDGTATHKVAVQIYDPNGQALGGGAPLPISGTVTANNPNGALTTRFGSVATANLAFITSAVTNTSRKYLLAQNISAGTVTIGIGFSPTTTQGIQLTAGGGLTFDAFCPTGAVYWLGAVTGAAFTILEG